MAFFIGMYSVSYNKRVREKIGAASLLYFKRPWHVTNAELVIKITSKLSIEQTGILY